MKTPITQPIAILDDLTWLKKDGSEIPIVARIGMPYQIENGDWACPAELQGVDGRYPDMCQICSFSALVAALTLIRTRLCHLIQNGERIFYLENQLLGIDELNNLFGIPMQA